MHIRILSFLLVTPLLLYAALTQLHVKTDISAFFISGQSEQMKLLANQMQTGEISRRYLLSIKQKEVSEPPLAMLASLRQELLHIEGVSRVWGTSMSDDEVKSLMSFYLPYRYHLYTLDSENDIPQAFSEAALEARAHMIRQALISPQGAWVRDMIQSDPMFLLGHAFQRLSAGLDGHDKRSQYIPLVVETDISGLNTAEQAPIYHAIQTAFRKVNQTYGSAYTLEMTGVPVFALTIKKQVEKDVTWISSISITLMVLLFLVMFRSIRSLMTVMLILLVSAATASLVTSWVFGDIYALTLALGTTLIGICVDYPIHTMVHIQASDERADAAAKRIWPSLLLGAVTTMVGYAALSFTGFPGMQQIALYSAIGIVTSLLISRFIVPYSMLTRKADKPSMLYAVVLQRLNQPRWRLPLISLAFLSSGYLALHGIQWQDDLSQLSPSIQSLKEKDQSIRQRMQSIEPGRFILIHAADMEHALQISEQVCLKLESLKHEGVLQAYYAVYPWVASHRLQDENKRLMDQYLTDEVRQKWRDALEHAGLRSDFFHTPNIPNVKDLDIQDVLKSAAGRYISGQYVQAQHEVLLTIWLGKHQVKPLRQALVDQRGAEYVSQKDMVNEMNALYRSKAVVALSYGAIFIFLMLIVRYQSLKSAIQVLLPAVVSVSLVITAWVFLGYSLSILHLLGLLLAVAICVDYGIFFYENRAGNMGVTYQAIVMSALTTMVAFFCLALAENPALQILAWTIAPGVLLGFLLCPILVQTVKRGTI